MILDPRSLEYLNIPLVLDAESVGAGVHTDIGAARAYEREKEESRRIAEKIKAEERLPYEVKDVLPRRETRRGPLVDDDLPEIILHNPSQPYRAANTANQHHPHHGPRPVVRTVLPSQQAGHGGQSGAPRTQRPLQQIDHTTLIVPPRAQQSLLPQVRRPHPIAHTQTNQSREARGAHAIHSHPNGTRQMASDTLPVEARRLPGHTTGHGVNRPTIAAIPPTSFYAAIPRAGAAQPLRPLQHAHRVPPVGQQVIPRRHPVNEASERLAQGLREEPRPLATRHDIQLSSLTRSLLAGGGGLPAPLLIARRTLATPSSPIRQRRSTVQWSDDDDLFSTNTDAYHQALQAAEYANTFEDDPSLLDGNGFADGDFIEGDFEDMYVEHSAPDLYNGHRAYREGMAGPSRERFIPANQDRAPLTRPNPRRRGD